MTEGQKRATELLRAFSTGLTSKDSDPYYRPSKGDVEDSKYIYALAKKNEMGTLTTKEAAWILEAFDGHAIIIDDGNANGGRWVEAEPLP